MIDGKFAVMFLASEEMKIALMSNSQDKITFPFPLLHCLSIGTLLH